MVKMEVSVEPREEGDATATTISISGFFMDMEVKLKLEITPEQFAEVLHGGHHVKVKLL